MGEWRSLHHFLLTLVEWVTLTALKTILMRKSLNRQK